MLFAKGADTLRGAIRRAVVYEDYFDRLWPAERRLYCLVQGENVLFFVIGGNHNTYQSGTAALNLPIHGFILMRMGGLTNDCVIMC
jgi:hypothetical protein